MAQSSLPPVQIWQKKCERRSQASGHSAKYLDPFFKFCTMDGGKVGDDGAKLLEFSSLGGGERREGGLGLTHTPFGFPAFYVLCALAHLGPQLQEGCGGGGGRHRSGEIKQGKCLFLLMASGWGKVITGREGSSAVLTFRQYDTESRAASGSFRVA